MHRSGLRRWALVPVIFWLACATGAALAQVGVLEFKLKTGAERYIQRPPIGIVQQVVPKDDVDRVSPFKPPNKVRTSQVPTSPTECDALSRALLDAEKDKAQEERDNAYVAAIEAKATVERKLVEISSAATDAERATVTADLAPLKFKANLAYRKAGLKEPYPDVRP